MTDGPIPRLNAALEGRYRIERQLGEGGMATVYLADDLRHERRVALKVLKPELAAVVGADRFLAEIKTTANLQHPHILPLFDSGEADSFLFYVMPYVEGESLRERLDREHQLPVDEAVQIAKNVAEALDYAHSRGVIHRDIKPANILLQAGKPVVSDFGIALAVGAAGGGRLTETGLSLGTPHYMSPEQATGDLSVGPAADIYALGCVLYEMLVGDPPHVGSTAQAVLGKIVTGDADPVRQHRRSVPTNVDAAVRKALEKVPADRFASAAEFEAALSETGFRHGESMAGTVVGSRGHWNRLSAALAVIAIVAIGVAAWALARTTTPMTPTVRFRVDAPADQAIAGWRGLAVAPDGQTVLFADEASGQLFQRALGETDPTPIPNTEQVFYPFFSPDGEWVAYFDQQAGVLKKVRLDGSENQTIASVPGTAQDADWGTDGVIVGNHSEMDGLWRVRETGGNLDPIPNTEGPSLHWMDLLPGDRALLAHQNIDGVRQVVVVSLETGERTVLFEGATPRYVSTGHVVFWRQDGLYAVVFDVDRLTAIGEPSRIVVDVTGGAAVGLAWYAVGGDVLFFLESETELGTLVAVDRSGVEEPLEVGPGAFWYPRISPDGNRIAAALTDEVGGADVDIWVFDLIRGGRTRVTFGGQNRYFPVWTPQGDALTVADGTSAPNRIYTARADGSGLTETVLEREGLQYPTSWSRDGQLLAFHENHPESARDVWVLPVDGEPQMLVRTPFEDHAPTFSPNGQWVAYVSDKSGQSEVYVQPYPGPGPEHTVSTEGGTEPVWSRDGSELFYRSQAELMSVPVNAEGTFRADPPRPLFDDTQYWRDASGAQGAPFYDVMPDGQHFVMVRASPGGSGIVVLNFTEEVNRLVPTN